MQAIEDFKDEMFKQDFMVGSKLKEGEFFLWVKFLNSAKIARMINTILERKAFHILLLEVPAIAIGILCEMDNIAPALLTSDNPFEELMCILKIMHAPQMFLKYSQPDILERIKNIAWNKDSVATLLKVMKNEGVTLQELKKIPCLANIWKLDIKTIRIETPCAVEKEEAIEVKTNNTRRVRFAPHS